LFVDYVAWAKSMLNAHGVLVEDLIENLNLLKAAVGCHLPQGVVVFEMVSPVASACCSRCHDVDEARAGGRWISASYSRHGFF
jgi:hypothetical protein